MYEVTKEQDPKITHRYIAQKVGFTSSGFFTQVLQGLTNISIPMAEKFAKFFRLKANERKYFVLLVQFNQAKTHQDKIPFFEELIETNKRNITEVDKAQYQFFDNWYNTVIREAISFIRVYDTHESHIELAKLITPSIKPIQVKKSLQLLTKLKFIQKRQEGYYERTDRVFTTGNQAQAIGITQIAISFLDLAKNAVESFPREERSISSLTLCLSEEGYQEIEKKLQIFRRELLQHAYNDTGVNRVYQVNFQAFPLTKQLKQKGQKDND